jgi:Cu/Ag efflux protein CusF
MKRIVTAALAGAKLLGTGAAFAAEATGLIKSVDTAAHKVMLGDQAYWFPSTVGLSGFKAGEKVKISYAVKDGKNQATMIAPAS